MSDFSLKLTHPDGTVETCYTPTLRQAEFHARTEANVLMFGGRGSGKSKALRWEAHMRAMSTPNFKYVILRRTYPQLQSSHLMFIAQEMKVLGGSFHHTNKVAMYPNGSRGVFSHCAGEEDVLNLLSAEFFWGGFDELSTFEWDMFTRLAASIRVPNESGLTAMVRAATNPLGPSADMIRRYFVDKDVEPEEDPDYNPADWYSIKANLSDNPYIDQEQYRKRFSGLSSTTRKAWLDGEFVLENALFDFYPTKSIITDHGDTRTIPYHVLHDLDLPEILSAATVYRAIDVGWFPDPTVVLWIAHLGTRYIVFHEIVEWKKIAPEIAEQIKRVDERLGVKKVAITYCLPLDAPVWMGDFTFKPLSEVKVGDVVISGEQKGIVKRNKRCKGQKLKRLEKAVVTAIHRTRQEVVKITFKSGRTAFCTPDHRWLSATIRYGDRYVIPKVGGKLVHVVDIPPPCADPITAAWIAGMYDGEGCRQLISQDRDYNKELHFELQQRLETLGFKTTSDQNGVRWLGGMQSCVNFVNQIPSIRYKKKYADRGILISHYKTPDEIVSIESCGVQDVGCLTTTTGNFIAYGYQTSNCDPSMDVHTTADIRTVKDIFESCGIPMESAINSRELFASSVHTALNEEAMPNVPRLQIYKPGCPYLVKTLPMQRYDPKHPLRLADHRDDHAVVALAYFLMTHASESRMQPLTSRPIRPWMKPKHTEQHVLGTENVRDR